MDSPACPKCGVPVGPAERFCQACGQALVEGAQAAPPSSKPLGSLVENKHRKQLKGARSSIMVVAVLTFLGAGVQWFLAQQASKELEAEVQKVRNDPTQVLLEDAVATQRSAVNELRAIAGAILITGFVYIGLFFWAKGNPFAANLTALILFVTIQLLAAALNPVTLAQGWLVKILVIAALVNGVKSGLAFKRLQAQESRGG